MANSYFNENTLEELIEEIKYVYKSDERPWVIGYSGGKDSTTVVELVYKMLLGLDPDDRHKNVYIVSSDTLIENPLIKIYLSKMNDLLGQAADRDGLPIKSAMVTPPPNNSFWANVIGRGFPTPRMNGTFRWCTDRLKINPSGEYIQRVIDEEGKEVVVLLGVRKAESIARKRRIEGRELANRLLNRHETIQDAYVYNPIVELTTDDVWDVLLRCDGGRTPWGSDNAAQLKETIDTYLANHPEVDKGRIYLAGVSNGGGMVLTMGAAYPDYFAALIPIAAPLTVDQSGIDKLKNQPMWLIHTKADATVQPENSVLPLYKSLITSGATNKWFSYFETATGTDLPGTEYDGHWAWIYFFHDQVIGVQHPENTKNWDGYSGMVATDPTYGGGSRASVNGQTYNSIFDWMSAQRH